MTLDEAFLHLLSERGVYKKFGVARNTVSSWRKRRESGEMTDDLKRELLAKAGWRNKESWEPPEK